MFNLIAETLELIYRYTGRNYIIAIVLLTVGIYLLLTPLTVKFTKSMLEMREVQPEIKKLREQYGTDRMRLNQELSALYRTRNTNPLSGCLPPLLQMPVFFVLYRIIRGITRRATDIGVAVGELAAGGQVNVPKRNFNPNWLDSDDTMFIALSKTTEMLSWGLDLAPTPWAVLTTDIVKGLPYIVIVGATGALSYLQQKQISVRNTAEPNPTARIIMRVFPLFIVFFSFILPAALAIYFLTAAAIRVIQQHYITKRIYKPHNAAQILKEETQKEDEATNTPQKLEKPKPAATLPSGRPDEASHGSSPLSRAPKPQPPKAKSVQNKTQKTSPKGTQKSSTKNTASTSSSNNNKNKKRAGKNRKEPVIEEPTIRASKRVTPKKNDVPVNQRTKKKRR